MPPSRFLESRTQTVRAENATSTQLVPPEALLIFQSSEDGGASDIFSDSFPIGLDQRAGKAVPVGVPPCSKNPSRPESCPGIPWIP
jgi:hypothetical protein